MNFNRVYVSILEYFMKEKFMYIYVWFVGRKVFEGFL